MFWSNVKFVALPISEISIGVLGGGCDCEPQSWRRGGRTGSGMVTFERALVSSYKHSIVINFSSILRVSEILPLLCSSAPLFPTHL